VAVASDRFMQRIARAPFLALVMMATGCGAEPPTEHPRRHVLGDRYPLSADFVRPGSKQGAGEARMRMPDPVHDARYARLRDMGIGYRQYNAYWESFESAGIPSSDQPLTCPAGHEQVPRDEAERRALGFHRYRCINSATLAQFDALLARDQRFGMQSGMVLYSAPELYRYRDCEGFTFGGNALRIGCVPRDDVEADYEDFVNLLASRYRGGPRGKLTHVIVWNENASADWFDYTPVVGKHDLSVPAVAARLDKLTRLLQRTHAALQRHLRGAIMYVSTDPLWDAGIHEGHMGTRTLLESVWARVGLALPWAVAVHPYGDPTRRPSQGYTFANLDLVIDYQRDQLRRRGVSALDDYPQSYLIASEQGWPYEVDNPARGRDWQARQVCLAHRQAVESPYVLAVAHNYFHSVEPADEDPAGQSGQGAFFGLIPYSVGDDLAGVDATATGRAFIATAPRLWSRTGQHDCCARAGVGCFDGDPRLHPDVYSYAHYTAVHADLASMTPEQARSHWLTHGIAEGRWASPVFRASEYLRQHDDLVAAFGPTAYRAAIDHYVGFGIGERRAPRFALHADAFDVDHYRDVYPDLRFFNEVQARDHWLAFGIAEGRAGTSRFVPREYLALHPDLARAFGDAAVERAIEHWVEFGRAEGRPGRR